MRSLIFSFIIVFFLSELLCAQQKENVSFEVNSKTVENDSYAKKILSLLAIGNNKDLSQTHLLIENEIVAKVDILPNGKIEIKLKSIVKSIKGETKFRKFNIKKLLSPSVFTVKLELFKNKKLIFNDELYIQKDGLQTILETSQRIFSETDLVINMRVISVNYSLSDYNKIDSRVELINNYYGFSSVLDYISEKYKNLNSGTNQNASQVFLIWQETERLKSKLKNLDLEHNLLTSKTDPENLRQKYSAFKRQKKRWNTIAKQKFERELKRGFIEDKKLYVNGLIAVSEGYYAKSLTFQPFMSSAYRQMIIIDDKSELVIIGNISNYYDALAYGENVKIPQLLYDDYVNLAQQYYLKSKNNMALSLLKNAKMLQKHYDLQDSERYTITASSTLNGMIESFLKVSNKAIESGKLKIAQNYYNEAEEVYEDNKKMFVETGIAVTPFLIYVEAQKRKIKVLLENKSFYEADLLIDNAIKISEEKNLDKDDELNDFRLKARNGILGIKLKEIQNELNLSHLENAYNQAFDFSDAMKLSAGHEALRKEFGEAAYSVFIEFLQQGEILLDKNKYEEAFVKLLKAKHIQTELLGYEIEKLDKLLKDYSEPKILSLIEQARLENWAKRNETAESFLAEAKGLQVKYQQQNNAKINSALSKLLSKMQSRHCLDAKFKLKNLNAEIVRKINSGKFDQASDLIKSSYLFNEDNPDCDLNTYKTDNLIDKYSYLLDFYQSYSEMKNQLFAGDYYGAISNYQFLRSEFLSKDISSFNFSLPSLSEFVKQQNMSSLTLSSIEYFMKKEQFLLAFEYLGILNSQGVNSAESKGIQLKLAKAMKSSSSFELDTVNEMLNDQGIREKWYKYFSREVNKKSLSFDFK